MIREVFVVENPLGLHARAAGKFMRIAAQFKSEVRLARMDRDGRPEVDGKSLLEILTLAAPQGTSLRITIEGEDEQEAAVALRRLIDRHFGEA